MESSLKWPAAPSHLAAIGRYAFNSEVFELLRVQTAGVDGEIQLTDSINAPAEMGKVDALQFFGRRCDGGSMFGYLEAIVDHALEHPRFGPGFTDLIEEKTEFLLRQKIGS